MSLSAVACMLTTAVADVDAAAQERAVDQGWDVCMEQRWSPKTSLVYTCPLDKVRPAREFDDGPGYFRFQPNVKGKNTYGAGMEDCALICGVALSGLCDRWLVTKDPATAATARKVARGVLNLATLHGFKGFVARGICVEDGRSVCSLSSRDQYTHWLHGLFRYCESGMADDAFRAEVTRAAADVARYMETRCTPERNWNFGMVDGSPDPRGICTMWGPKLNPHEHARLPMIYIVAWKLTGDNHWRTLYEAIVDEAIDKSVKGMADPKETKKMPCYSLLQANSSFETILMIETDHVRRKKLVKAMAATASVAHARAMAELKDTRKRFYGMCDDGELAITQLMSPRTPVTDDDRRFLQLVITREDLSNPKSCRAAHVFAAYWRFRARGGFARTPSTGE